MDQVQVGSKLMSAGRLEKQPLFVYASDAIPVNAIHISKVDRCVSHAMFAIAREDGPTVYLGEGHLGGCCPGGQYWLGYIRYPEGLSFFISTGSPTFRNGAAEYLKRDPKITEESIARVGKIAPPGKFILIAPFQKKMDGARLLSVLCFGKAENIRNLIGLAVFGSDDTFGTCIGPWGPACSSMITYASGMAEKAPKGALIVGPSDPTVNEWVPPEMMTLSIPVATAERMANDVDSSFLTKRPKVAFPEKRVPS
ncbi:MAG: DUF169 domain-containing protein [Methanomassiliicoccales archaeon]|jgi:hypothetical protein